MSALFGSLLSHIRHGSIKTELRKDRIDLVHVSVGTICNSDFQSVIGENDEPSIGVFHRVTLGLLTAEFVGHPAAGKISGIPAISDRFLDLRVVLKTVDKRSVHRIFLYDLESDPGILGEIIKSVTILL